MWHLMYPHSHAFMMCSRKLPFQSLILMKISLDVVGRYLYITRFQDPFQTKLLVKVKGDLRVTQIGGSNAYYVNLSWTPNAEQQSQTHLFCYTADGLGGNQTCTRFYRISAPKLAN